MAKKQTRRSVSIRGSTYEQVRLYCEKKDISMSEFVEERIATFFESGKSLPSDTDRVRSPKLTPQVIEAKNEQSMKPLTVDELKEAARYFTF